MDLLLKPEQIKQIDHLCKKRLDRMPVQYIIQEWDFRDLTLKMSRPVFIPRPETEMLVDIVLNEIDRKGADTVLELCCGSGAISLALLKARSQLCITAIDKSEKACQLTRENAHINNLSDRIKIIQKEINEDFNLREKFDIIVSNPPYVSSKDTIQLQPEILLYEDPEALYGGDDGLTVIKSILKVCSCLLNYHGRLFLEVDPSHPTLIKLWLQKNDSLGLKFIRFYKDFCDKERFVEIIKEK
ncbi:hypothetical protein ILUMI_12985 [Ignelater luminosus]|uniref:peptide chain release factor N(5)-glutamine methyltransferase n=1 Tax=Ignelater luminosus TaxID=2038154 RepID=A0A8K0GBA3_IGNLU|nr:hypothetical protein ILUMI_12985 [Ignelater luminosus]